MNKQAVADLPKMLVRRSAASGTDRRVDSTEELLIAVSDPTVGRIIMEEGTYKFSESMCPDSAICINRTVVIEAATNGAVVLDASSGAGRVIYVSAQAELRGLNITGGSVGAVSDCTYSYGEDLCKRDQHVNGGAVYVASGAAVKFESCNIYSNSARNVRMPAEPMRPLRSAMTRFRCPLLSQGGGIYVSGGIVTFDASNIYSNMGLPGEGGVSCSNCEP